MALTLDEARTSTEVTLKIIFISCGRSPKCMPSSYRSITAMFHLPAKS